MGRTGPPNGGSRLSTKRAHGVAGLAVIAVVVTLLLVPTVGPSRPQPPGSAAAATAPRRPSVVLVVLDDLSMDLLRTMRSARAMRQRGASYRHSYVVDSLCCVSRASTFTGQYPHQTGVRTNVSETSDPADPVGGWPAFQRFGNPGRSVNVRLHGAGYTTGYVGKYLNEYEYKPGGPVPPRRPDGTTAASSSARPTTAGTSTPRDPTPAGWSSTTRPRRRRRRAPP